MRGTAVRLCSVLWLFGYVLVDVAAAALGRSPPGLMFLVNLPLLLLGIAQSVALGMLLEQLDRRPAGIKWPLMVLAGICAAAVQTLADHLWLRLAAETVIPSWQSWAIAFDPRRLFIIFIIYFWTVLLSIALIWAARSGEVARRNEARASASDAAASRAEAAALRLQLNPHFLFNTLNGITSMVVRGRGSQAEEMIGRLADFLRATMTDGSHAMISLAQELRTIRAYLHIEEARFGDRLRIIERIDPGLLDLVVPNFILQPLVENAIKHGTAGIAGSVAITISASRRDGLVLIEVINSGGEREAGNEPEAELPARGGIGLDNVRRRLAQHYGSEGWLEVGPAGDGYRAAIGLPWSAAPSAGTAGDSSVEAVA